VESAVVRMKLVGARPPAQWAEREKLPGISNYFLSNDPNKWRTNVQNYGRVVAKGVYRGIDLACYGNQGKLEYDLIVAPGADSGQVRLAWEGADSLRVNQEGDLAIATRLGEMVQKKPQVYQEVGSKRVEIETRYQVLPDRRVNYELARYDRSLALQIDPVVLVYSTYLGGWGEETGEGIAVDGAGSAYVTGETSSSAFPTHSGYQADQGGSDAFVTKLTPAGNALIYSTYLGGNNSDHAYAIAVDGAGSAYVTGQTSSLNFPTQLPYQATLQGPSSDVFVTKLTPAGNALVYSTYLGGNNYDYVHGIAVDAAGSAYVTGETYSTNFPNQSPYQATFRGGGQDVFVTKLTPAGSALVYSTYLGGNRIEYGYGIAVDGEGSAYVTG
jgi:hypothetical protein